MSTATAVERALALLDMRRPQEALDHLGHAVAAAPEVPELHCLVALAYLQLGNAQQALTAADAAVANGPEQEWGHRLRAVALLQVGAKPEARSAALAAARLAPEDAATHIVLASALQANGDEAGAVAAAQHAIELDPDDAHAHAALGEVLFEQDRHEEAGDAYERALELDPEDADSLNNLAVARRRAYGFGGIRQFEAAARMDPRHDIARHNLLHTGPAGRSFVYRRISTVCLALAIFLAFAEPSGVLAFLVIAAVFEFVRWLELGHVSEATRRLLDDDRRARRLKLRRWDWSWPTRLRPWWWVLLTRLPAPLLLGANVLLLIGAIASGLAVFILLLALALPFSALRTYRWFRRRHPGAGSWRPPA